MKYLVDRPDHLVIQEFRWFWALFCLLMLGSVALQLWQADSVHWAKGAITAVAMGALVICIRIFSKRTVIEFKQSTQQVHWTQTGLFFKSEKRLEFSEITQVVVETTVRNGGSTMSRVVVHHGTDQLPVTRSFTARFEQNETLALKIRELVNPEKKDSSESLFDDSVRALISQGLFTQAVTLLVRKEGISVKEAHSKARKLQSLIQGEQD